MSALSKTEIEYPESDGAPMGETDVHIDWTIRFRQLMKHRYRGQQVYVGSDLFIYYTQGNPRDVVAPDGFVVLQCDPARRQTFKLWEEKRVPNFVLEITSRSSRRDDVERKHREYARIGVPEYFLYDPLLDYLNPPLQGYRLVDGAYRPIPVVDGALASAELGVTLSLDETELILKDSASGEILRTPDEAAEWKARRSELIAIRQKERAAEQEARAQEQEARAREQEARAREQEARAEAEAEARLAAERRIAELEAELRRRES